MKTLQRTKLRNGTEGFTLAELMMGSAVTVVVFALCLTAFVALNRAQAVCLTRSGMRTEIVRYFDSLELDLRDAKSISATASGSESALPLTITVPQRYSTYETSGDRAGDPESQIATRVEPTVDSTTGKLSVSTTVTILYDTVANGSSAMDIRRTVTWTESGTQRTATRSVSTIPSTTTVRFRSSNSTSTSPSPVTSTDVGLVARVSAPLLWARSATAAPTTMESTIFLRQKTMK